MKAKDIEISHPDKILFPACGVTKQDVADYYEKIGDHLLPTVRQRPLTFKAFPEGISRDGFFNKNIPKHFPDFIKRVEVSTRGKDADSILMATAMRKAELIYFAGQKRALRSRRPFGGMSCPHNSLPPGNTQLRIFFAVSPKSKIHGGTLTASESPPMASKKSSAHSEIKRKLAKVAPCPGNVDAPIQDG